MGLHNFYKKIWEIEINEKSSVYSIIARLKWNKLIFNSYFFNEYSIKGIPIIFECNKKDKEQQLNKKYIQYIKSWVKRR